mgnify:CR=1 FL=1
MKEIKVEGNPDLIRDASSKAIINKNQSEYNNYIKTAKIRQAEKNRIDNMESDLSSIKTEMNEIKDLLKQLISK